MSDFPELEDFANTAPVSQDPSADFLARERALLGDEFGHVPQSYAPLIKQDDQLNDTAFGDFRASVSSRPAVQATVSVENEELSNFQDQYPDLSHNVTSSHANEFAAPVQSLYATQSSFNACPTVYLSTQVEEESEHIKLWRERQLEEINERDVKSKAAREQTIMAAERAIDEFYLGYNAQKEKNIARNKEQEDIYLKSRDDALGQGTTWERIADIIELQDSRSKTCGKSTRDLSRFKEVLLSLKREGTTAPGAAGY